MKMSLILLMLHEVVTHPADAALGRLCGSPAPLAAAAAAVGTPPSWLQGLSCQFFFTYGSEALVHKIQEKYSLDTHITSLSLVLMVTRKIHN